MFPEPREINFGTGDAKEQISVFSQRVVIFIPMAMNGSSGLGEVPIKFKISYLLFRSSFIACPGQDQPVN